MNAKIMKIARATSLGFIALVGLVPGLASAALVTMQLKGSVSAVAGGAYLRAGLFGAGLAEGDSLELLLTIDYATPGVFEPFNPVLLGPDTGVTAYGGAVTSAILTIGANIPFGYPSLSSVSAVNSTGQCATPTGPQSEITGPCDSFLLALTTSSPEQPTSTGVYFFDLTGTLLATNDLPAPEILASFGGRSIQFGAGSCPSRRLWDAPGCSDGSGGGFAALVSSVTAVPAPPAAWLAATGIVALLGRARRRVTSR